MINVGRERKKRHWKDFVRRLTAAFLVLGVFLVSMSSALCASSPEYTDFSELEGKNIAMLTGAPFEELIKSKVGKVGKFSYFSSVPDMTLALKDKKIDAYLNNSANASLLVNIDSEVALFPENLGEGWFGMAFKKNSAIRNEWQSAYDTIPDRKKRELWEKWTGADESIKTIPEQSWPGKNGTVKVAACDTLPPMSYRAENGKVVGFDVEMVLLIAEKLDVHVEFIGMEFASLMPSVQSGKAEIGIGGIMVTDERAKMVDFLNHYPAAYVLIVRPAEGAGASGGFFSNLKASFTRTFITESRYKMVASGLFVTLFTAVASGALGLVLAFMMVMLRARDNRLINKAIKGYQSIIAGLPAVVILMVLYYIVFGKINMPAVFVAVIGFALIFASSAFTVIWNALSSVSTGQLEAALSLGYTEKQAFSEIILPQARPIYLPMLQAQFVSLLKETSIAGYITVVELTRAGDLIRSRTMEAFFPLIAIALIYWILIWLLSGLVDVIEMYFENKKGKRHIEGVD